MCVNTDVRAPIAYVHIALGASVASWFSLLVSDRLFLHTYFCSRPLGAREKKTAPRFLERCALRGTLGPYGVHMGHLLVRRVMLRAMLRHQGALRACFAGESRCWPFCEAATHRL